MDDKLFNELLSSIKQAGEMRRKDRAMHDLLESKDILSEPRVVKAWHGLIPCNHEWYGRAGTGYCCSNCEAIQDADGSVKIPVSIYEAAFRMRDACRIAEKMLTDEWLDAMYTLCGYDSCIDTLTYARPEDFIVAATLAWEAKGGGDE